MTTRDDLLVAAGHSVSPARWPGILDELMTRIGARFRRVEPRRRARSFVLGLMAELPRKNCWTISEHAGDASPDGMQHLLARARWDARGVRDDVRGCVTEHLGDPDAVLAIDETGDLKKGTATGVGRQYAGTTGRIENAQVAVYLGYAAPRGHALIDRELYLPKSWTGDPARCRAAGIPDRVKFATKPQLARRMIARAIGARVPFAGVAGDEAYGDNGPLRAWLKGRQVSYVLAVSRDHRVPVGAGRAIGPDELAARLPPRAWQRLSAGDGAKGRRYYDWAWVSISDPGPGCRRLLIRRNRRTGEPAFYRCYSPHPVPLVVLVKVVGLRWTIEENFQAGKRA
jgi:SRSO17 transposase